MYRLSPLLVAMVTASLGALVGRGEEVADATPAARPRMTMLESSGEDPLAEVEKAAKRAVQKARRAQRQAGAAPAPGPSRRDVAPAARQAAVERGARFLTAVQRTDGGWNSQGQAGGPADLANTSIAGLALLKAPDGKDVAGRDERVARATHFVLRTVAEAGLPDRWQPAVVDGSVCGDLGLGSDAALAALFLAEQAAAGRDEAVECRAAAGRLLEYVDRRLEEDPTAFRQRAQGLTRAVAAHAAEVAGRDGIAVPENLLARLVEGCPADQQFYGQAARVGCLHAASRQAGGNPSDDAEAVAIFDKVMQPVLGDYHGRWPYGAGGEVFLSLMFLGAMLTDTGTPTAVEWSRDVDAMLVQAQNQDGSWTGSSCINSRVFCTSSAMLVMGTAPPDGRVAAR